jgi:hypothetical protein
MKTEAEAEAKEVDVKFLIAHLLPNKAIKSYLFLALPHVLQVGFFAMQIFVGMTSRRTSSMASQVFNTCI